MRRPEWQMQGGKDEEKKKGLMQHDGEWKCAWKRGEKSRAETVWADRHDVLSLWISIKAPNRGTICLLRSFATTSPHPAPTMPTHHQPPHHAWLSLSEGHALAAARCSVSTLAALTLQQASSGAGGRAPEPCNVHACRERPRSFHSSIG